MSQWLSINELLDSNYYQWSGTELFSGLIPASMGTFTTKANEHSFTTNHSIYNFLSKKIKYNFITKQRGAYGL